MSKYPIEQVKQNERVRVVDNKACDLLLDLRTATQLTQGFPLCLESVRCHPHISTALIVTPQ
jgi:hypothetical protein